MRFLLLLFTFSFSFPSLPSIISGRFIPEIKSVALLATISPTQSIWTLHYTFPPPVSPRIFTVLQAVHVTGGEHGLPREAWIISVPVDVSEDAEMKSKEAKGVRGRYASVEVLKEKEDGTVEWRWVLFFSHI